MDVMDIYKAVYTRYKEDIDPDANKYEWVSSTVFGLVTYDPLLDKLFVERIFEVCKVIIDKNVYDYIEDRNFYTLYILVCQWLNKKQWINWGTSIRGAWFDDAYIGTPDNIIDVEYYGDWEYEYEYTRHYVPFSESNLSKLIEFVENDN